MIQVYVYNFLLLFFSIIVYHKILNIFSVLYTTTLMFIHPIYIQFSSVQFSPVIQLCLTLCDPVDCSTPGLPVHHQLPEFTETHAY